MHPLLHLLCLTHVAPWDVKRFICRGLTYLLSQPPGAALRVGPGLSPAPTRGVALGRVLAPAPLCCSNLEFLLPEALLYPPLPGQRTHQQPYGKKAALR